MRPLLILCVAVLSLGLPLALSAGQDGGNHAIAFQPTVVPIVKGASNTVQLGLVVNGQFAYPFAFQADPALNNGVTLDGMGVISGTPTNAADQNVTVTVTDSVGKTVAKYPIVIHVADKLTVMLGTGGAASTAPAAPPTPDPASKPATVKQLSA